MLGGVRFELWFPGMVAAVAMAGCKLITAPVRVAGAVVHETARAGRELADHAAAKREQRAREREDQRDRREQEARPEQAKPAGRTGGRGREGVEELEAELLGGESEPPLAPAEPPLPVDPDLLPPPQD